MKSGIMVAWTTIRCCINTHKGSPQAPKNVNKKTPKISILSQLYIVCNKTKKNNNYFRSSCLHF